MSASKASLLKVIQQIINGLGVDKATLNFEMQPQGVRLRLECNNIALCKGNLEGLAIDSALIYIEGFDPDLPVKEALKQSTIRVEKFKLCLAASLLNRLLDNDKAKADLAKLPVDISGLHVSMASSLFILSGKVRKGLVFPFTIELKPGVVGNNLRVAFENFWATDMVRMPDFLRRLLMSVVSQKIASKPSLKGFLSIDDDKLTLNPWSKIPLNLQAKLVRFGVEGHFLVLELGPQDASLPKAPKTSAGAKTAIATGKAPANTPGKAGKTATGEVASATSAAPVEEKAGAGSVPTKVSAPDASADSDDDAPVLPFV